MSSMASGLHPSVAHAPIVTKRSLLTLRNGPFTKQFSAIFSNLWPLPVYFFAFVLAVLTVSLQRVGKEAGKIDGACKREGNRWRNLRVFGPETLPIAYYSG